MKKARIDTVWQTAFKLFVENAKGLQDINTTNEEQAAIAIKERSELLARRCFWFALHGIEQLDIQHEKLQKRITK